MTRSSSRIVAGVAIPVVLAIGVVVVLVLQSRQPTSQAAPATAVPATTTPPPVTTSKPDRPGVGGENWLAIMSDILTYRHSLYENPQPNLLDQIYDKRCPFYARERSELQDLARKGWRYNDNGVKVLKARLRGRGVGNSSIVAIEALIQTDQQLLVDRAGAIQQRKAASGPTKMTYGRIQGSDHRWRVSFVLVGWVGG